MNDEKWLKLFYVTLLALALWLTYHLAYAHGAYVEMMGGQRQVVNCQAVITHNGIYQ